MKPPVVTIVVPAYQRLDYLREALASALAQTYSDFELIVTDDGASDEIAAYVASLKDPRIRYRRNPRNLGIAMNNYVAFAEARGRYIASLHDDDFWEPDFLATLVPYLEADPEITIAFCDHYRVDAEGRIMPEATEANTRFFKRDLLTPGRHQPFLQEAVVDLAVPMVMAAVFRKTILDGAEYPPRIGGAYDHWLAYLALRQGEACYYVPRRLTRYRVHGGSGTVKSGVRNLRDAIYVRRKFLCDPTLASSLELLHNGLGVLYGRLALHYLADRSPRRGRILLAKAFSLLNRPRNIVALAVKALSTLLHRPSA